MSDNPQNDPNDHATGEKTAPLSLAALTMAAWPTAKMP